MREGNKGGACEKWASFPLLSAVMYKASFPQTDAPAYHVRTRAKPAYTNRQPLINLASEAEQRKEGEINESPMHRHSINMGLRTSPTSISQLRPRPYAPDSHSPVPSSKGSMGPERNT